MESEQQREEKYSQINVMARTHAHYIIIQTINMSNFILVYILGPEVSEWLVSSLRAGVLDFLQTALQYFHEAVGIGVVMNGPVR